MSAGIDRVMPNLAEWHAAACCTQTKLHKIGDPINVKDLARVFFGAFRDARHIPVQKSKHRKRRDDDDDEPDREHVILSHVHEDLLRLCHVGVSMEALEIRPRGFQTDEESSRRVHAWAGCSCCRNLSIMELHRCCIYLNHVFCLICWKYEFDICVQ
jgi:hypothetical protein